MYQLSKVRIPEEEVEPVTTEEKSHLKKYVVYTITGSMGVVLSSYFLVESAVNIATAAGLSQQVIGATIIAVGTSLPELTLDLKAILKGHAGLAFGDIIGSCFVNITLILGISLFVPALLGTPVELTINMIQNLVLFSIVTNLLFWYFLSRGQIGHKEGLVFLFIYILFIVTTIATM
jgi:cation:H+ antiporter